MDKVTDARKLREEEVSLRPEKVRKWQMNRQSNEKEGHSETKQQVIRTRQKRSREGQQKKT